MAHQENDPQGTMGSKIAWAENCCRRFAQILLRDDRVKALISGLERAILVSRKAMVEAGIPDICESCEKQDGGSCCGKGMEDTYDGHILLINLLLGYSIPKTRRDASSCLFLGKEGCLLSARHVICINYLCKKVTERVHANAIFALREKEGTQIEYLFLLKERILEVLKLHGVPASWNLHHKNASRRQYEIS